MKRGQQDGHCKTKGRVRQDDDWTKGRTSVTKMEDITEEKDTTCGIATFVTLFMTDVFDGQGLTDQECMSGRVWKSNEWS